MSNSTDARLIIRPYFATYCKTGVLCVCIAALLLSGGCGQKQKAIDLYVDAVVLKEFNENEKAIEKLKHPARAGRLEGFLAESPQPQNA